MCGRFAASASVEEISEALRLDGLGPGGQEACTPRYNLAPTDLIPAVVEKRGDEGGQRLLVGMRWGLIPSWSKDASRAASMINARVETVAVKPAFRKAFAARRCLIPALGYYEWKPQSGGKQPYFLTPGDGSLLLMAGIQEWWRDPARPDGDDWVASSAIITTSASDETGWIHDRMPMTVRDVDTWLSRDETNPETALSLLVAPTGLDVYPVSTAVGNVRNDSPELVKPAY